MEILLFTFFNIDQNAFFLNTNYIRLHKKTGFRFSFGLQEVPQTENAGNEIEFFNEISGWGPYQSL